MDLESLRALTYEDLLRLRKAIERVIKEKRPPFEPNLSKVQEKAIEWLRRDFMYGPEWEKAINLRELERLRSLDQFEELFNTLLSREEIGNMRSNAQCVEKFAEAHMAYVERLVSAERARIAEEQRSRQKIKLVYNPETGRNEAVYV